MFENILIFKEYKIDMSRHAKIAVTLIPVNTTDPPILSLNTRNPTFYIFKFHSLLHRDY